MRFITHLLIFVLFVYVPLAAADRVEPTERVTSRLIIRDAPAGNRVGALNPHDSAAFVGSVPYWYEIRLDNGQTGFVSKSWSRVVPEPDAAPLLRLGGWNIRKLGHGSQKDYARVARVIEDHFDVVAVVEVMQKSGGHPGYDQLMSTLGTEWAGLLTSSPRPDTSSGSAEFYAILYRPNRVGPCAGWTELRYYEDNPGSPGSSSPDRFSREPAFSCFRAVTSGAGFDFMLAAYHARWADGDIQEIQDEVRHLPAVFSAMSAANPGEKDLLVIGDFNLVPADLDEAIDIEVPTMGAGSTLNGQGGRTGNLYDHLVVRDRAATSELVGTAEVIDVRDVATSDRAFFKTVSDHLPIVAKFRAGSDDD